MAKNDDEIRELVDALRAVLDDLRRYMPGADGHAPIARALALLAKHGPQTERK